MSLVVMAVGLLSARGRSAEVATAAVPADHAARMQAGLELFRGQVRAVLTGKCLACHGGAETKADFDLSDRDRLLASGHIGDSAAESHLMAVVTHASEPHMPLKADKLADDELAAIGRWLDLGAPYDRPLVDRAPPAAKPSMTTSDFWSFQPLAVHAPPEVRDSAWCVTPVDRFVLAAQESRGLRPNGPADRRVLIRRASFDLLGLPPEPADVEAFVADSDPQAYESLIDRLLASPRYGERWARHWLDVARFAESHGYEQDYDRPFAYHYRDYVIQAWNQDQPFDEFVRWQLAGDELAPHEPLAWMATGFLGAGAFPTQLTETEFERARYDELDDMTATTGVALLGLSIGCARCHDHKFDPISSEDYYRLAATFTNTIRSEIDLKLKPEDAAPVKVQVTSEGLPHTKHNADDRGFPHFYPETHVLARGDVHQKLAVAAPGFPKVLVRGVAEPEAWAVARTETTSPQTFRRAALARWITDVDQGAGRLLARVAVNRIWQHHFGRGLVATPNDFGVQGERPSHPALLDWLATDLVHHSWRVKRLHKLIMTSAVYMQDGAQDAERSAIDPENIWLWRRAPRRLEAEPIRDAMLAVSGVLDSTPFGPGTLDAAMNRRSIYFSIKRSQLIPTLMLFDWPEHLVSIGNRGQTTIAPQALLFLNGPQTRRHAEGLAQRAEREAPATPLRRAHELALGRPPDDEETHAAVTFVRAQAERYQADGASEPARRALVDYCQALFGANEFIYID